MIHNTKRSSKDNVTELTGWKQVVTPGFNSIYTNIKTRTDTSSFVDTTKQVDDNFTRSVVIDNFEFSNVTFVTPSAFSQITKKRRTIPCFCITVRNLTITLEQGLIKAWRFPFLSAFVKVLRASLRALTRTMVQKEEGMD